MYQKTKDQLEETYRHIKPYLNSKDCCEELHAMCKECDKFCGIKKHDYEKCKDLPCFKNWLGFEYLEWRNSWS